MSKAVALACGVAAAHVTWPMTAMAGPPEVSRGDRAAGGEPSVADGQRPAAAPPQTLTITGRAQPVPGRVGHIAPAVLHPVARVLVAEGDRVTAGQPLVELLAHEHLADVRAKTAALAEIEASLARFQAMPREEERAEARAALEAARVEAQAARQVLERLDGLRQADAVSVRQHQEALTARLRADAAERAAAAHLDGLLKQPVRHEIAEMEARVAGARAELEVAEAGLKHCTLTAPIAGVISRLAVSPGMVSEPGTSSWGEILELSQIDVRCDVAPDLADRLARDQPADVRRPGSPGRSWSGRVVFVGLAADPQTGMVPVVLRIEQAREQLRAHVEVSVHLQPLAPGNVAGPRPAPPSPVASTR